ncbi:MAG: shikimate kinase, partial [Gammaproteobacteria bacterium]|nr:shikimate kinase [Gammaproteobacteria bacterium]
MKETENVFLIGPMGAGKTTVGRLLARDLGLEFLDSDHEIEKAANASISWIFDMEGEAGFRRRETRMIARLTERQEVLLATGGGAVLDPGNRNLLKDRGIVVYLYVSLEAQLSRKLKDENRPLLRTGDREQRIRELYEA